MTARRLLFLFLLPIAILAPAVASPSPMQSARDHYEIAHAGRLIKLTDIIDVDDDANKSVTLLEMDGRDYVFTRLQDYRGRRLVVEVREMERGSFLRATYSMPYGSGSRQEVQKELESLPPSAFVTPLRIETNSHLEELRIDRWQAGEGQAARSRLLSRIDGQLLRDLKFLRPLLGSTGPAGHAACRYILENLMPGGSCRRSPAVAPVFKDVDCAFDARFGYSCRSGLK